MRHYVISGILVFLLVLAIKKPAETSTSSGPLPVNVSHIYPKGEKYSDGMSEPVSKKEVPATEKKATLAPVKEKAAENKPKAEIKKVTVKSTLAPLKVNVTKNPGRRVKELNEEDLREYLTRFYKMRNLEDKTLLEMRRIWLAYAYDQFYWDVHERTGLPVSVIYAYFIMEATVNGLESDLMAKYRNPGGVKYRGIGRKTKAYDDCYNSKGKRIKCDFAVFDTYDEMVAGWSQIFNAPRYKRCKSEKTAPEICECLYRSGYHTGNNWSNRAAISKGYWTVRQSFPQRK